MNTINERPSLPRDVYHQDPEEQFAWLLNMEPNEGKVNIENICNKVENIISSCNDNMKGLTCHKIAKEHKNTDLDKLCSCKDFEAIPPQHEAASYHICSTTTDGKDVPSVTLNTANIVGPCEKNDCRVARDMRAYVDNLIDEDNIEIDLNELVGPCGGKDCNFLRKLKDFILHRGVFANAKVDKDRCSCEELMKDALVRKGSCDTICSHKCEDFDILLCGGEACVHKEEYEDSTKSTHATPSSKSIADSDKL